MCCRLPCDHSTDFNLATVTEKREGASVCLQNIYFGDCLVEGYPMYARTALRHHVSANAFVIALLNLARFADARGGCHVCCARKNFHISVQTFASRTCKILLDCVLLKGVIGSNLRLKVTSRPARFTTSGKTTGNVHVGRLLPAVVYVSHASPSTTEFWSVYVAWGEQDSSSGKRS